MRGFRKSVQGACACLLASALGFVSSVEGGDLRIEIITAYNFVVDSNVESPSSYGPDAAYIGARFCNAGTNALTDVYAYAGDYNGTNNTPGIYPSRPHMGLDGPLPGDEFALTHEGGSGGTADATRRIGTLEPGECRTIYWLVSYPTLDEQGKSVAGPSVKPDDDLWLEYDIWGLANDGGVPIEENVTRKATMRSEISASANKIMPSNANKVPQEYKDLMAAYAPAWTNVYSDGTPGTEIWTEGFWYDLGNVGQGFDNNGDLVPDRNAWMQPVGDAALFDASSFRLVKTYALVIVKLIGGGEQVYSVDDQLYFENIPPNNGAVGMVRYQFMTLKSGATSLLTPYQEVASGFDNEKFNSDYGASPSGPIISGVSSVTVDKTSDSPTIAAGSNITYTISYTNAGGIGVGKPSLGIPLVVVDSVPDGTSYVAGSATNNNLLPPNVSEYTVLYSTNNGVSWQSVEPPADQVTDVQWWLSDELDAAAGGSVGLSVTVDDPYAEPTPIVCNTADITIGGADPFVSDQTCSLLIGTNSVGDTVFLDTGVGGGTLGNGVQDGTEPGMSNVTLRLYYDADSNGVYSVGDFNILSTNSSANGAYSFDALPDGNFLVIVDRTDPDIPYGYTPTLPTTVAVPLDPSRTNALPVAYLDADFAFAPVLGLDKTILGTGTNRESDTLTYEVVVTNRLEGNGGFDTYYVWATNLHANSGTGNKAWDNATNAYIPAYPDGQYATAPMDDVGEDLQIEGYRLAQQNGNITKVDLYVPITTGGSSWNKADTLAIIVYDGATTLFSTNYDDAALAVASGLHIYDLTATRSWDWSTFASNQLSLRFETENAGGPGDNGTISIDQAGFRVQTDWSGSLTDPELTLASVPLVDTYDADKLEFVSGTPAPDSVSVTGTVGTLTWDNLGPVYPGGYETITAQFLVLEPPSNTTTLVTNIAAVTDAAYGDGNPANTATASVSSVVLPAGSIGDLVWRDLDSSGTQNSSNETGMAGVSVVLTPPAGVDAGNGAGVPVTNVTDASGYYLFDGLPADGVYTVAVLTATLPGGSFTNVYDEDGTNDSTTAVTLDYDATDGSDTHLTTDFGYLVPSLIQGTVWNDVNRDGDTAPDVGESGLSGVTVYLFSGPTPGDPSTSLATNTTDATGAYEFLGDYNGTYSVLVLTNSGDMAAGTWTQSYDSDGLTSSNAVAVSLVLGGSVQADFSYYETGARAIGDTLFYDWDGDGIQDAIDEGITNITVSLYLDTDGDGVIDPATDPLVGIEETDTDGEYLFSNLPSTNYIVRVHENDPDFPASYVNTADPYGPNDGISALTVGGTDRLDQDFGYQLSGSGSIGDTVWRDRNGDGVQAGSLETGIASVTVSLLADMNGDGAYVLIDTAVTDANGNYLFSNLPDGPYRVEVDAEDADIPTDAFGGTYALTTPESVDAIISGGNSVPTADFGFAALGAIGDTIFWDANRDGGQNLNEAGITGVIVNLYLDIDGDGYFSAGTDTFVTNTVTSTNGLYLFSGLAPDDYVVVVSQAGPIATASLSADPSSDGVPASDPSAVDADGEYGLTIGYGQNFMGVDFGYAPPGVLGDTLWMDLNANGIREVEEAGIAYVTVELWTNGTLVATNDTDSDGIYLFSNLPDGTYNVIVATNDTDFPGNLIQVYDPDGTLDHTASSIVVSGGVVTEVDSVACTNCDLEMDFGYRLGGTNQLSGTVGLEWTPTDGVMGTGTSGVSSNESPLPGTTVYLWLWNDDGDGILESGEATQTASTNTSSNGDYAFTGLPDGGSNDYYIVSLTAPLDNLILTTTTNDTPAIALSVTTNAQGNTESAYQVVPIVPVTTNVDFAFTTTADYDFGDLPVSYATLSESSPSGARHIVPAVLTLYLGSTVDTEDNGQPSVGADGDGADEDGVMVLGPWFEGSSGGQVEVTVGAGSGWLVGYLDMNRDGDFADAGELIISEAVSAGITTNAFDTLSGSILATNKTELYARFRLLPTEPTFPEFLFSGEAANGEVEDYLWSFGSLGDRVWVDLSGDGVQDAGEPGMDGVRVFVDANGDGIYQTNEVSTLTDANGAYAIGGFPTGTFDIAVDTNTLWASATPSYDQDGTGTAHTVSASLTNGEVRVDVDFGYDVSVVDLAVTKTADKATVYITNELVTFTITLDNLGPADATGIYLAEQWPASGLAFSNAVPSQGSYDHGTREWDVGALTNGGSASLVITGIVTEAMLEITNLVSVWTDDQWETNLVNNTNSDVIVTRVLLSDFRVSASADGGTLVEWTTDSELNTAGFDLYRLDPVQADYRRLNTALLPGLMTSPQGGTYRFTDSTAPAGVSLTYRLDELELDGTRNSYGPFIVGALSAKAPAMPAATEAGPAYSSQAHSLSRVDTVPSAATQGLASSGDVADRLRITVSEPGLYRVDAASIADAMNLTLDEVLDASAAHYWHLSCQGRNVAWAPDGDGILFYAEAFESPYTRQNTYWLASGPGVVMPRHTVPLETPTGTVTTFNRFRTFAEDLRAPTAIFSDPSEDVWVWDMLVGGHATHGDKQYAFSLTGIAAGSATVEVRLRGGTTAAAGNDHHARLFVNGTLVGDAGWKGHGVTNILCRVPAGTLQDDNALRIVALLDADVPLSRFYLEGFSVTYPCTAVAENNSLTLAGAAGQRIEIGGFSGNSIRLLDLSSPDTPVQLAADLVGPAIRFVAPTDGPFLAAGRTLSAPVAPVTGGQWRRPTHEADYVVIAPDSLVDAAAILVAYRAGQGLASLSVPLQAIYDEYNFGIPDPNAIRAFLGYAYRYWARAPRYVVLLGDGSYDYRDVMGMGDGLLPPVMVATQEGLQVSDNALADVTGDGLPDMAIGRIPVRTPADVTAFLAKLSAYEQGAAWRERLLLLADNSDAGGSFSADSSQVRSLAGSRDVISLTVGSDSISTLRSSLVYHLNAGVGLFNYMGHGGVTSLAGEGVFRSAEIDALSNSHTPPVMVAVSCSVGQFAIPGYSGLGELMVRAAHGGAVAAWAPVGSQYHADGRRLDLALMGHLVGGSNLRLGDSVLSALGAAQATARHGDAVYVLLGDPAMTLKNPVSPVLTVEPAAAMGYAEWQRLMFAPVQGASGAGDDANGDGISNWLVYLMGGEPLAAGTVGFPILQLDHTETGQLTLRLRKRAGAAATWRVEACTDLVGSEWQDVTDGIEHITTVAVEDTMEEVTLSLRVEIPERGGLFLRAFLAGDR